MITITEYFEVDSRVKNVEWADKLITHFRMNWNNLVNPIEAKEGMKYLLTHLDMSEIKEMFKEPDTITKDFAPIAIMEKVRNILIAERNKAGIFINLNALDPSAKEEKDADVKLLKNRPIIESQISSLHKELGLPEYKLSHEKQLSGSDVFHGNIEQFDEMNLSESDDNNIDYFFKTHYKLRHEIAGQDVINYFVKSNELKNNIDYWCNDIMAKKAIAMRCYVNEISGAIEYKYMAPEKIKLINNSKKDGKDALCIGYEDNVSVGEFIRMVGNDFDWERDINDLIRAVNHSGATNYTGIFLQNGSFYGNKLGSVCTSESEFLQFKVAIGYIEWKSVDANAYRVGRNYHGNDRMWSIPPTSVVGEKSRYSKETYFNEVTYKSYFLQTSGSSQRLYKFGKLFHQVVEGSEDEYSNFSIIIRKQEGPTVAMIAKPFIKIAQEAFYKFKWFVKKAKPGGRSYSYESLVKVATHMINSGNKANDIHAVIKMFEEGINEMYMYPEIDGQKMGGGTNPNHDKKNGLDPTAMDFSKIIDWAVQQINDKLGVNSIREAYSPSPNDGYKLQMQSLQQSRNATDYMSQMILSLLENTGKYTLAITQDIIRYKDSKAYKYLKTAVGSDTMYNLEAMKGYAFHRYGIFIDTFNNDLERQEIKQATQDAWVKGEITYETMLLVNGVDDPKKAGMVLSFEKWRKQKDKAQEVQQAHDNEMALKDKTHQDQMEVETLKGKYTIAGKNVEGKWYYEAHKAGADAKIIAQQERMENEPEKIKMKTESEIQKEIAKNNLKQQEPS